MYKPIGIQNFGYDAKALENVRKLLHLGIIELTRWQIKPCLFDNTIDLIMCSCKEREMIDKAIHWHLFTGHDRYMTLEIVPKKIHFSYSTESRRVTLFDIRRTIRIRLSHSTKNGNGIDTMIEFIKDYNLKVSTEPLTSALYLNNDWMKRFARGIGTMKEVLSNLSKIA